MSQSERGGRVLSIVASTNVWPFVAIYSTQTYYACTQTFFSSFLCLCHLKCRFLLVSVLFLSFQLSLCYYDFVLNQIYLLGCRYDAFTVYENYSNPLTRFEVIACL